MSSMVDGDGGEDDDFNFSGLPDDDTGIMSMEELEALNTEGAISDAQMKCILEPASY